MFKYTSNLHEADQVMPEPDANPGWVGNGQDAVSDINDVTAANEGDITDPGFAAPPTGPMTQPDTGFSGGLANPGATEGNPDQVAQQNAETGSGSNVQASWNKEAYRRVLATDTDLYNQGIQDRLRGKEMDEALANLSDDYRFGYEQGGFYGDTEAPESAPAFEHVEMHPGSDKITRNPVATRHASQRHASPSGACGYCGGAGMAGMTPCPECGGSGHGGNGEDESAPGEPEDESGRYSRRHSFIRDADDDFNWEGMKPPRGDAAQGKELNTVTKDIPQPDYETDNVLFPPKRTSSRYASRIASDPFSLENDNAVIEGDQPVLDEDHNNTQLDPGPYDNAKEPTGEDDYTLEKDPEDRGMNSSNPTTTGDSGDYNEGLSTVGSIITSSKQVLADGSWFRDSSESIYDRLEILQTCINNLKRSASSNQVDETDFNKIASLLHEGVEQFDQLQRVASEYVDFDTQEYLQSLPGGTVASNYASLDRDGDIGPDDGSFLYREAARVRDEVANLDIEQYTKVSAKMYVEDQPENLLRDSQGFREASLYFVFNDTLPILDSVKRAAVIDEFMTEAERNRRVAIKQLDKREASLGRTASAHKTAWVEDLDEVFGTTLWT